MSLWDQARRWLAPFAPQPVQAAVAVPQITRDSSLFGDLFNNIAGLPVLNEDTANTISAITGCVNLIAGAVQAMPGHIYRESPDGERQQEPAGPLWYILNEEFHPRWSAASAWDFVMRSRLLHGDAYIAIRRDGRGNITTLEPIHPRRVYPMIMDHGNTIWYRVAPNPLFPRPGDGEWELIYSEDMLHVTGPGFNGVRSPSPLRYSLRMVGAVTQATQDYSARFFANSARPDYALTTPGNLDPATIEALRGMLADRHAQENAHRPMVLSGGLDIKTITMPTEDVQLLETRRFQIEEIARVYGVPPFMIGHTEKTTSWGSGVEQMGTGFLRYCLRTHLDAIQTEFNRKLFKRAGRFFAFDPSDLTKADTKELYESLRIALGRAGEPGFMTPNEVRRVINRNHVPGGDALFAGLAPTATDPSSQIPQGAPLDG